MTFNGLHNDDGIVNDQADGQHQAEERQGVDGESEKGKEGKGADEGNRNGEGRNEGRPPSLKEDEDDDNDQRQRYQECFYDLTDAFGDGLCRIETDGIIEIGRKSLLGLFHDSPDAVGRFDGIRAGQLVDADIRRRVSHPDAFERYKCVSPAQSGPHPSGGRSIRRNWRAERSDRILPV